MLGRTHGCRAAVAAAAAMLALAALPAMASATPVASIVGDTIQIVDSDNAADDVSISAAGSVTDGKVWEISGAEPGAGCEPAGGGAFCDDGRFRDSGVTRSFDIDLAGGDDELVYAISDSTAGESPEGTIDLGAGADTLESSATSMHTIAAGDGNDAIELTGFFPTGQVVSGDPLQPVTVDGGAGNDTFQAGLRISADVFIGGPDFDTVSYLNRPSTSPVTVTLNGVADDGRQGASPEQDDVRNDIEGLVGTPGADALTGNAADQTIDGAGGADVLAGAGGTDTLSFGSRTSAVTASLTAGTTSDGDTIGGFENLRGGSAGDTLTGDGGANRIEGGGGADTLDGRGGTDQLVGEAGSDTADYSSRPGPITASLDGNAANDPDGDTLQVENLRGTAGDDTLRGGTGANALFGLGGNDTLDGGNQEGTADTLDGGAGAHDLADYASRPDQGFLLIILSAAGGEDTLTAVEDVEGSGGPDFIAGDGQANLLDGNGGDDNVKGGLGADDLRGGAGLDTLSYQDAARTAGVTVSLDGVANDADGDVFSGFARLLGSGFGDTLTGGDGNDDIDGGPGPDTIRGGLGSDFLFGNTGNDVLDGGPGTDPDTLAGDNLDSDTADYSARTEPVSVVLGNGDAEATTIDGDTLLFIQNVIGGSGDDRLIGNSRANLLRGGPGNDKIDGAGGDDTLQGRAGDDVIGPLRATPLIVCFTQLPGGRTCSVEFFRSTPSADGRDGISGGDGDDILSSVDGVADASVACGAGSDGVRIDLVDPAPSTLCESVSQAAVDQHPTTSILSSTLRANANGAVRLQLGCPKTHRGACTGRVVLRRGGKVLGAARYTVRRGRKATVSVRLRPAAARAAGTLTVRAQLSERDEQRRPVTASAPLKLRVR